MLVQLQLLTFFLVILGNFGLKVVDDILDEPIILREDLAGTREVLFESLRQQDIYPEMLNVVMELGNAEAIEMAVEEINNNKEQWGTLLTERNLVPPPLLGTYNIPDYPPASVPSRSQFADALQWALEKGLMSVSGEAFKNVAKGSRP